MLYASQRFINEFLIRPHYDELQTLMTQRWALAARQFVHEFPANAISHLWFRHIHVCLYCIVVYTTEEDHRSVVETFGNEIIDEPRVI